MSGIPNTQDGGTSGVRVGSLKRRLKPVTLALISSTFPESNPAPTIRLLLKNLNGDLNVQIACGVVGRDGNPIRPSSYPALGSGTLQLTPINNFAEGQQKLYLRPVFQDPTAAQNENHPLPQDLPYGWEFSTRADEVEIEIILEDNWVGTGFNGYYTLQVTIEYDGEWWDKDAVNYALSQVTLTQGPSDLPTFASTGGG